MAQLPSLALGLGLQGKPIDRAALNLRRAEGEERAALRAQQRAQKELEPYKKRLMELGNKAYLPVHKNMMADKYASAMKYMVENGEDVDRMQLGQMVMDMESFSNVAQKEYNQYVKNINDEGNSIWADELRVLGTATDRNTINETLKNSFGLSGEVTPEGNFAIQMRKPVTADAFAETIISDESNNLWQPVQKGEIIRKGKSDYLQLRPREGVVDNAIQSALSNEDVLATEGKLLLRELGNSGVKVDLTNESERAEFIRKRDERIANKIKSKFDITKATPQSKGMNITNNLADKATERGGMLEGYDSEIPIKFNNKDLTVKSYESNNIGNQTISMTPTTDTKYADGRPYDLNGEITYSQVGISYLTKNPVKIKPPKDFSILNLDTKEKREALAEYQTESGEYNLPKGFAVPFELQQFVVDAGADLEAKIIAWGIDEYGQIVYRDGNPVMQSAFFKENNQDKNYLQSIKRRQVELQKAIEKNKPKKQLPSIQSGQAPKEEPKSNLSKWDKNKR